MARRARHLRPCHHEVPLDLALTPHRHRRSRSRIFVLQTESGDRDFVNTLFGDTSLRQAVKIHLVDEGDPEELEFERLDDEAMATGEFDDIDALLTRTSRVTSPIEPPSLKRDDSGLVYDDDWDEEARLSEWREHLKEHQTLPPLMAAGLALDAWETIEPQNIVVLANTSSQLD